MAFATYKNIFGKLRLMQCAEVLSSIIQNTLQFFGVCLIDLDSWLVLKEQVTIEGHRL